MATIQTIKTVIRTIQAAYPNRFVADDDTVMVWKKFVEDIDDDLLLAALSRFISSADHAFPPSIPELRGQATEIRREIASVPTAFEAWNEVLKAPHPNPIPKFENGVFVNPQDYVWTNDVVGVVAKRLGWPKRFPTGDNDVADRAHFVKAYDAEVGKRLQAETQLPVVTQYIEQQKSKRLLDVSSEMKQLAEARKA